ncbi:MAG: MoaD/ThiS family protein [Synergistales bacterium]|jgi:sulfur carrier protein ThiS
MAADKVRVLFRGLPSEGELASGEFDAVLKRGSTVADLLAEMAAAASGKERLVLDTNRGTLRPEYLLTLNGRFLDKPRFASTVLQDGDAVEVFPMPSGG